LSCFPKWKKQNKVLFLQPQQTLKASAPIRLPTGSAKRSRALSFERFVSATVFSLQKMLCIFFIANQKPLVTAKTLNASFAGCDPELTNFY